MLSGDGKLLFTLTVEDSVLVFFRIEYSRRSANETNDVMNRSGRSQTPFGHTYGNVNGGFT